MRKTQRKYLFRTIKKNSISFVAVALIAAMTISLFMGFRLASKAVKQDLHAYFIDNKLETLQVLCANGITNEDLNAIASHQGVDIVEGGYSSMVVMSFENEKLPIQAMSLGEQVNIPVVIEGNLPENSEQVAIEEKLSLRKNINLGDSITLEHYGSLVRDTFVVTAIINCPDYCSSVSTEARGITKKGLGAANFYIGFTKESFDVNYFQGSYTIARVRNNSLDTNYYFSKEYEKEEKAFLNSFEGLARERADIRYETLLEEAKPAIEAGLMSESQIKHKDWIILNRKEIGDLCLITPLMEVCNELSLTLSVLFLFVTLIVCYATTTRIIDEQRELIGAQKALGFSGKEIIGQYMIYNLLSGLLAVVVSILTSAGIQKIALTVYEGDFLLGNIPLLFDWKGTGIMAVCCLAAFALMSYFVSGMIVNKPATTLMRRENIYRKKPFFFEKWIFYKKIRLYTRVMIKNVLSEKERMLTTVIGVVGSMCMMVISFNLKLSITEANELQHSNYFLFENRIIVDTDVGNMKDFEDILGDENISYTVIQDKAKTMRSEEDSIAICRVITARDNESIKEFIALTDIYTDEIISLPEEGLLVSRKCAEEYNMVKGSTVTLMDLEGNPKEFKVVGVIEHYHPYHLFVASEGYYESVMGEKVENNVLLVKKDLERVLDDIVSTEGYMTVSDDSEYIIGVDIVNVVIAVLMVLSLIVSLLVILNQLIIHINRKARELAIIRINGYTINETKSYVYKDNVVLTVMGVLLGNAIGMALTRLVVSIIESNLYHYVREPFLLASLYACGVVALFSVIVNIIGLRRIKILNMTNVNTN